LDCVNKFESVSQLVIVKTHSTAFEQTADMIQQTVTYIFLIFVANQPNQGGVSDWMNK